MIVDEFVELLKGPIAELQGRIIHCGYHPTLVFTKAEEWEDVTDGGCIMVDDVRHHFDHYVETDGVMYKVDSKGGFGEVYLGDGGDDRKLAVMGGTFEVIGYWDEENNTVVVF